MRTILPAVTCSAQATMLTGLAPSVHGAVGNGWYMRETGEAALWRQANALLSGEKLYEAVKRLDPAATTAKIFWWWNMGAAVDLAVTPRPFYPADGRKIPAIYAAPTEYGLELERDVAHEVTFLRGVKRPSSLEPNRPAGRFMGTKISSSP